MVLHDSNFNYLKLYLSNYVIWPTTNVNPILGIALRHRNWHIQLKHREAAHLSVLAHAVSEHKHKSVNLAF